ncbi:MAG: DNA primase [Calditrichaeota bacterium]|nr:MAG: DNA primase [Calditrichota bacterium]
MLISEAKIQEIREATDIVEIISGYVSLKKKGRNYFGLCPFHTEKTPSFSVNPEKQIFHCFGCGAGGNIFTFLMRHEGMSFTEAVKYLAKKAGIQLVFDKEETPRSQEAESLYLVNEFAARFFKENLFSPLGKQALEYLKNRGFSKEDLETFSLGFAPPGWENLVQFAKQEAQELSLLVRAGLVAQKGSREYYDRFRNRIIFPIQDLSGRIVAFAGRKLNDEEEGPKYINTPETEIYHKSRVLYGLYQGHQAIRELDYAIFVEGYTDVISLFSAGIKNVVATSGTALTEEQAKLIRRYTRKIFLMYDADTAGSTATLRGADILLANDLEVNIATLPESHDPDSFVREYGKQSVEKHLEEAQSIFDFKLNHLLQTPEENRTEAIRSILESLAQLKDSIRRSLLVRTLAERLAIHEKILWDELQFLLRRSKKAKKQPPSEIAKRLDHLSVVKKSKKEAAAEDLVKLLIHDWDLAAPLVFEQLDLNELNDSRYFAILNFMKNQYKAESYPNVTELVNHCYDVELASFIVQELEHESKTVEWADMNIPRWVNDCIITIKVDAIQKQIESLREEIRFAQQKGQSVQLLLRHCVELEQKKQALEKSRQINFVEKN